MTVDSDAGTTLAASSSSSSLLPRLDFTTLDLQHLTTITSRTKGRTHIPVLAGMIIVAPAVSDTQDRAGDKGSSNDDISRSSAHSDTLALSRISIVQQ